MSRASNRLLRWLLGALALAFAIWSTALVHEAVTGRARGQRIAEIMEAVSDLQDRALLQLSQPSNDVLEDWDADGHDKELAIAEAGFRASRAAFGVVLQMHSTTAPGLAQLDNTTEAMIAHAHAVIASAHERQRLLRAGAPAADIRNAEVTASRQMAEAGKRFRQAHDQLRTIEESFRARQAEVFQERGRVLQRLYILLVLSLGTVVSSLWLLRRNRQQQDLLTASEVRYRSFIENASDVLFSADAQGRIRFANVRITQLTGYSPPELLGKGFVELVAPEERESVSAAYRRQHLAKTPTTYLEFPILTKTGERRWVGQTVDTNLQGEEVVGFQAVVRDITDRRRLEESALREQRHLRALLDGTPLAIARLDSESRIAACNPAFEQLFQYRQQEICGQRLDELLVPESERTHAEHLSRRVQAGERVRLEGHRRRKDGTLVEVEIFGSPVVLQGKPAGLYVIYDDISERKRTEEQLRLQSTALESAANAIVITNPQGTILWVNPAFTALTGYTAQEVVGQNPRILKSGHHSPAFYQNLWQTLSTGQTWHGTMVNRRKDGSLYDEEMTITPVRNLAGEISHFIAIKQDITARNRAQQELLLAKKAAETATQLKSEFLANMSHEIRTPMNGIIGMTDLLLDTRLDRAQREYVESVKECADSLLTLLNDILDFSKIEAGRLELETTDFDLRRVVEGAVEMVAPRAAAKRLELLADIDPAVPTHLRGDPVRLRQVLTNLLGNAVKFTERGEVVVQVKLVGQDEGTARVCFAVRDTGIGIPHDKQKLIFDKFAQADGSTTRRYGGTGLGLSISCQLIALMGGHIEVESEPGTGSRFFFTLSFPRSIEAFPHLAADERLQGLRVLVVDDSATNRAILARTLRSFGYTVGEASGAAAAIGELRHALGHGTPYALAIIDHQMPDMDGPTLGRILQAEPRLRATRMLMLASVALRGDAQKFREIGFATCLTKPVRQSQLFDAIAEAMEPAAPQKPAGEGPAAAAPSADRRRHAARLLLAEDNPVNRKIALTILEKAGYTVHVARNGREAVETYREHAIDLILMDVQMPELDGLEATAAIRQSEAPGLRVPIIALTAHAMKGDRERCLAAGMDDYLSKPLQADRVCAMVATWLRATTPAAGAVSTPVQVPGSSPVNHATLEEVSFGDEAFLKDLLASYLADANRLLPAMQEALASGDSSALASGSHRLRGSSATLGAEHLAALLLKIELLARENRLDETHGLLAEAVQESQAVQEFLHARMTRPTA